MAEFTPGPNFEKATREALDPIVETLVRLAPELKGLPIEEIRRRLASELPMLEPSEEVLSSIRERGSID